MEPTGPMLAHLSAVQHAIVVHAASIPWASIFSGLGGLATAGALVVSLIVLRQNNKTQQQAQQDRHREHASQISFWLTLSSVDDAEVARYAPEAPGIEITVHAANTSDRPAMGILALTGVRTDVWRDAAAADGVELDERAVEWNAVAIAPGERLEIPLYLKTPDSVVKIVADYRDDALIGELLFTDAAGVDWVRTHDGRLIERRSAEWAENIHLSLGGRYEQRRNKRR